MKISVGLLQAKKIEVAECWPAMSCSSVMNSLWILPKKESVLKQRYNIRIHWSDNPHMKLRILRTFSTDVMSTGFTCVNDDCWLFSQMNVYTIGEGLLVMIIEYFLGQVRIRTDISRYQIDGFFWRLLSKLVKIVLYRKQPQISINAEVCKMFENIVKLM